MAGGVNEATILVKKADGTTARMSLADIKKMKEQKSVQPIIAPAKPSAVQNIKSATPPLASPPPEAKNLPEAPVSKPVPLPAGTRPAPDDAITAVAKKIIKDSGVNITPELFSRALSLVNSRLRGIRDENQFLAYAIRPGAAGGLGLDETVADRLARSASDYLKNNTVKIPKPAPLPAPKKIFGRPLTGLPMVNTGSRALATSTPVTDIFLDEAKARSQKISVPSAPSVPARLVGPVAAVKIKLPADYDFASEMAARHSPKTNELIRDIQESPKPSEGKFAGPADEMKKFNLRDWRRLGHRPVDCAEIILNKFQGWKEESYMLYLACRQAWTQSPLLAEYRDILSRSINTNQTVSGIIIGLRGKDSLTYEEFLEITKLNARLEM
ncbi:MAG: hypothetical protein AAB390_05285 [Patescibacteria group bacterium]